MAATLLLVATGCGEDSARTVPAADPRPTSRRPPSRARPTEPAPPSRRSPRLAAHRPRRRRARDRRREVDRDRERARRRLRERGRRRRPLHAAPERSGTVDAVLLEGDTAVVSYSFGGETTAGLGYRIDLTTREQTEIVTPRARQRRRLGADRRQPLLPRAGRGRERLPGHARRHRRQRRGRLVPARAASASPSSRPTTTASRPCSSTTTATSPAARSRCSTRPASRSRSRGRLSARAGTSLRPAPASSGPRSPPEAPGGRGVPRARRRCAAGAGHGHDRFADLLRRRHLLRQRPGQQDRSRHA